MEIVQILFMIKAVIFDVDGVLLDSFEANLKFFQDLMTKAGHRPPTREEFPALFHLSMTDMIRVLAPEISEEELGKIWKMGLDRGVTYDMDLLTAPDGAEEVIQGLSKKYKLGVVTSRVKEHVYDSPKLAGLEKYFQVTISFQDTVKHKPHPEPLLLAAEKLGIKPEECVYIGDVENDLNAAKDAGMKFIAYSKDDFTHADARTNVFNDIPALIASLLE